MYAGTVKASDTSASSTLDYNYFYWMYKTENYDTAPVAIWLNGGPGASSAFGNFLLNGPLKITETIDSSSGTDVYSFEIKNAKVSNEADAATGSWADIATMIYVDQPSGTGFSYSVPEGQYCDNMDDCATAWNYFMLNLFTLYPEL
jgi:carboxypeptidase D